MTVKQLRELLAEAPDEMPVMVMVEDRTMPGVFSFAEACECETGVARLGEFADGEDEVFLVMPHGSGVSEDDLESGEAVIPELN